MNQFLSKTILQCRTKSFLLGWTQARLRSTLTSAALKTAAPTSAGRATPRSAMPLAAQRIRSCDTLMRSRRRVSSVLNRPLC